MKKQKNFKNQRGITLVALIITIIVLVILAAVAINVALNTGIISFASKGVKDYAEAGVDENRVMNKTIDFMTNTVDKIEGILGETGGTGGGNFDGTANAPLLGKGMTAVKWNETKKEWEKTNAQDREWYNYSEGKWANAVTEKDGVESYWVWIPRYAYRITSGYHSNQAGEIDIKFLKGTSNIDGNNTDIVASLETIAESGNSGPSTVPNQYVVHPAFINNPEKGGWNDELTGIWVAKFEASHSDANEITNETASSSAIQIGSSEVLSVRPNVTSWRSITVNKMYDVCKSYDTTLNSHLMKNSEWGAVAYLAHSKYGRNKDEIGVNECSNFITGAGPKYGNAVTGGQYSYSKDVSESGKSFIETYSYTTEQGLKASTTGNIYGIYDMSGGSWEYVAACLDNYSGLNSKDSWTVDLYGTGYDTSRQVYGGSVWETSTGGSLNSRTSWYKYCSDYPNSSYSMFRRGGSCDFSKGKRFVLFRYNRWA